eukprot:m.140921 g.140921  ORF g.140921 m.140921 type:complete len:383 (+) comp14045_c0_seq6:559-1707(+)
MLDEMSQLATGVDLLEMPDVPGVSVDEPRGVLSEKVNKYQSTNSESSGTLGVESSSSHGSPEVHTSATTGPHGESAAAEESSDELGARRRGRRSRRSNQGSTLPSKDQYSTRNLYVSGLPPTMKNEDLKKMFGVYGNIVSAKAVAVKDRPWECQGYGFVMFESAENASVAVAELANKSTMVVQFAKLTPRHRTNPSRREDPTNLYFSNLPLSYDEARLKTMLEPYGRVVSCRILRDFYTQASRGVGFARMETHEVCETILEKFNGARLEKTAEPLICKFADSPKGQQTSDVTSHRATWPSSAGYWSAPYPEMGASVLIPLNQAVLVSPFGQQVVGSSPFGNPNLLFGSHRFVVQSVPDGVQTPQLARRMSAPPSATHGDVRM